MLAFSQVARSPAGPSRLMLLLALSVGLGLFALTFDASLVRNAADRAAYQVGADVRLITTAAEPPQRDAAIEARLAAVPGAAAVSPAYRHAATTTFDEGYDPVDLLAVDPASWAGVAGVTSWRGDYAATPLSALMAGLRVHQIGAAADDRSGATFAGTPSHPVWAIVSQTLADHLHVQPGDHFSLNLPDSSSTPSFLVVGAVVREFPTLYPTASPAGFVVLNLNDCLGAIATFGANASPGTSFDRGPNEYWIAARPGAAAPAALAADLRRHAAGLGADQVDALRSVEAAIAGNPLQAGMRGLLLVGALTAAALAVLGTVVQAALAARQRAVQFAVLRTMGMRARQLTAVLLGEQLAVYLVGLVGGTLLGLLLTTATLPFLEFSDTSLDPATVGIPPYVLVADPRALAAFYAALAVAFAVALLAAARYAATIGLGKTLRLGED
jgi:ABC-type lipoprotein release transport system permease subunit